jgi:outer membrane protein assembly factor BamB
MTLRRLLPVLLTVTFAATPTPSRAQSAPSVKADPPGHANLWPHWRGPTFDGASSATNLPSSLDPATARWAADMPGASAGTPIVLADRVFLTAIDARSSKLLAMCLARQDGRVLWSKEVGEGFRKNDRNNMASPSAVTDGKTVVFYYASGDLAAFDLQGNPLWARNLVNDYGPFNYQWIYGSSTTLYKGKLYVQVLHRDHPVGGGFGRGRRGGGQGQPAQGQPQQPQGPAESYLLAIDPATGKNLWRVVRPNEAVEESKESYGTPMPFEHGGKSLILLIGGDCVTAHDAETGQEVWRYGGWNPDKVGHWRMVPSVVTGAGLVFGSPPKGGPMFAIRPGGTGDVTQSHQAWKSDKWTTDVCVPLYYKGNLYVLDGDKRQGGAVGRIGCLDPATGQEKWSGVFQGSRAVFRASPTGGDNKIYCMNEGGQVWVLSADEFKVLYQGDLPNEGGPTRASISLADGQAFVRTGDKLYCFEAKPAS